ncbi:MAG: hypothetical protein C4338_01125, partial [Rhodanobacteraceae bacterium]
MMKVNGRNGLRIAVIVGVLTALGGHWLRPHQAENSASDESTLAAAASASGNPDVPPLQSATPGGAHPAETLKLGTLTLKPCELKQPDSAATTAAYCTWFDVPENRTDPGSRKI